MYINTNNTYICFADKIAIIILQYLDDIADLSARIIILCLEETTHDVDDVHETTHAPGIHV
jgi:hypothetical protein